MVLVRPSKEFSRGFESSAARVVEPWEYETLVKILLDPPLAPSRKERRARRFASSSAIRIRARHGGTRARWFSYCGWLGEGRTKSLYDRGQEGQEGHQAQDAEPRKPLQNQEIAV